MAEYILANTQEEYVAAATLFKEYAEWLGIDLCFQNFNDELLNLDKMYAAPQGGIILRKEGNVFTACVAVRKITDGIGELKRMWVQLPYQKSGIGKELLQEALTLAKECNYSLIRLDTLRSMTPAIKLYTKNGFYEIAPYYFNPEKEVVYFEKKL